MATIIENLMPSSKPGLKQNLVFDADPLGLKDQGFKGFLKFGAPPYHSKVQFLLFPFFRTTVVMYSVKGDIDANLHGLKLQRCRYWWRTGEGGNDFVNYNGYSAHIRLRFRLPRHIQYPGMVLQLDDAILFDPNVSNPTCMIHEPIILLGRDFFTQYPHIMTNLQAKHHAEDEAHPFWAIPPVKWYELLMTGDRKVVAYLEVCNGPMMPNSAIVGLGVYFDHNSAYNSFAAMSKSRSDGRPWEVDLMVMRAWLTGVLMIINAVENQSRIKHRPRAVIINSRYGDLLDQLRSHALLDSGLKGIGLEKVLSYANGSGMFNVSFETTISPAQQWCGGPGQAAKVLAMAGSRMKMVARTAHLNLMQVYNRFDLFQTFRAMTHIASSGRVWWVYNDHIYVGVDGVFRCDKEEAHAQMKRAEDIANNDGDEGDAPLTGFVELEF